MENEYTSVKGDINVWYYGKIKYTIDDKHPHIKYVKDWKEDKVFEHFDTFNFKDYYSEDGVIAYIKRTLKLAAGGGDNSDHIHNVTFEIKRLEK